MGRRGVNDHCFEEEKFWLLIVHFKKIVKKVGNGVAVVEFHRDNVGAGT